MPDDQCDRALDAPQFYVNREESDEHAQYRAIEYEISATSNAKQPCEYDRQIREGDSQSRAGPKHEPREPASGANPVSKDGGQTEDGESPGKGNGGGLESAHVFPSSMARLWWRRERAEPADDASSWSVDLAQQVIEQNTE
jgi:hypothetical protein